MHDQIDMERTSYNINVEAESNSNQIDNKYRVLAYKEKVPTPEAGYQNKLRILYSKNTSAEVVTSIPTRPLPSSPERVLNLPDLSHDYYLNLLDWGQNNLLAVGLAQKVYVWDSSNGSTIELMSVGDDDIITSVSWLNDGGYVLAIGTSQNNVHLWDVQQQKCIRILQGHSNRVSALAWNHHILSSGGKDSLILNHDVRISNHIVSTYHGHDQEICSLQWSPEGTYLASGGNDNKLCLFTNHLQANQQPMNIMTDHMAAVKVAWCPYQRNLLATGGGSADRTIKLWNTSTATLLHSVDTGSQVCSLRWNPHEKELLSSHGYAKNQLSLWKFPNFTLIKEFFSHQARVLFMAVSPDGKVVCSAGEDQKLAIWKIFGTSNTEKKVVDTTTFSSFGRIR